MGHSAEKVAKRHVNFVKWPDASAGRGNAGDEVVHPGNCLFDRGEDGKIAALRLIQGIPTWSLHDLGRPRLHFAIGEKPTTDISNPDPIHFLMRHDQLQVNKVASPRTAALTDAVQLLRNLKRQGHQRYYVAACPSQTSLFNASPSDSIK